MRTSIPIATLAVLAVAAAVYVATNAEERNLARESVLEAPLQHGSPSRNDTRQHVVVKRESATSPTTPPQIAPTAGSADPNEGPERSSIDEEPLLDASDVHAALLPFASLGEIRTVMRYDKTLLSRYGDLRIFAYRLVDEDLKVVIAASIDRELRVRGEDDLSQGQCERVAAIELLYWPVIVKLQRREARLYEIIYIEGDYESDEDRGALDRKRSEISRAVARLLKQRRRTLDQLLK